MKAMEAPDILGQCPFQAIGIVKNNVSSRGIIKAFPNIATYREYQALLIIAIPSMPHRPSCDRFADMPPRSTTRFLTNGENLCCKIIKMILPLR